MPCRMGSLGVWDYVVGLVLVFTWAGLDVF